MRLAWVVWLLAIGCGHAAPKPAPAASPPPDAAPAAALDEERDRNILARLDAIEQRLEELEERVAHSEAEAAAAEEADGEPGAGALGGGGGLALPPPPPPPPPRPGTPDPTAVYAVPIAGHPFEGVADARVTIVEARDFACPYCERVRATMAQLLVDYPRDLKIVYRNMVVHPSVATIPAQAACAAQRQGHYVDMANLIYDKGFNAGRDLSRTNMENLAMSLGLDMALFNADLDGPCATWVADDQQELHRFAVNATPSFFVNGRYISGARPAADFKALIDDELAKARKRSARHYYDSWVLGRGRTAAP